MRWSQLTILLVSNRALCRHESHRERTSGGALSHVRREAGRKVRTQHRSAPNRTAQRPPLGGLEEVSGAEYLQPTAGDEARRSKATFISAAAAALSCFVGRWNLEQSLPATVRWKEKRAPVLHNRFQNVSQSFGLVYIIETNTGAMKRVL